MPAPAKSGDCRNGRARTFSRSIRARFRRRGHRPQPLNEQKDEALEFGADHYFATSDPDTFTELAGRFDLILNTVSANLDVDAYLSLLRIDGTLVNVERPLSRTHTVCSP